MVLEAPLAIFFAAAVWPARRWLRVALSLLSRCFSFHHRRHDVVFHQSCDEEDKVEGMLSAYRSGAGLSRVPTNMRRPARMTRCMAIGLPDACLVTDPAVVLGKRG